jgi:chorismate mutase
MSEIVKFEFQSGDLDGLRIRLDQMTERITSRLKDRSRFPTNETIYIPDSIPIVGRRGRSLLEFALEGLEFYHASLGRYDYSDQYPVLGTNLPSSSVIREADKNQLPRISLNSNDKLISFYKGLITKYCQSGDNPDTYGETAYIDADLIQMIHERINIGRYVADVKGQVDPSVFNIIDNDALVERLKDRNREEILLRKVGDIAQTYGLDQNLAMDAFKWIIAKTIEVEVAYIHANGSSGY